MVAAFTIVILAVGARFDDRVTNNPAKFCPDATIIHIDVDEFMNIRIGNGTLDDVFAAVLETVEHGAEIAGQF